MNSKEESYKNKQLGNNGEDMSCDGLMESNIVDKVVNLNDIHKNEKFVDLMGTKGNKTLIFTVKTRNKYTIYGNLNGYYKLGKNSKINSELAKQKYGAELYWIAVQVDRTTYSIYMGTMEELNGHKSIPIRKCEQGLIGKILVHNRIHNLDYSSFTNQRN